MWILTTRSQDKNFSRLDERLWVDGERFVDAGDGLVDAGPGRWGVRLSMTTNHLLGQTKKTQI